MPTIRRNIVNKPEGATGEGIVAECIVKILLQLSWNGATSLYYGSVPQWLDAQWLITSTMASTLSHVHRYDLQHARVLSLARKCFRKKTMIRRSLIKYCLQSATEESVSIYTSVERGRVVSVVERFCPAYTRKNTPWAYKVFSDCPAERKNNDEEPFLCLFCDVFTCI